MGDNMLSEKNFNRDIIGRTSYVLKK